MPSPDNVEAFLAPKACAARVSARTIRTGKTLRWILLGLIAATSCATSSCANDDQRGPVQALDARVATLEAKIRELEAAKSAAPVPSAAPPKDSPYEASEGGWSISGGGRDVYEVHLDPSVERDGHPTVRLSADGPTRDKYGTWARSFDATPYRGKRVRFSAFTRTEGTTKRADFWARVQASDSPGDGSGLGGHSSFLPASSDWKRQEIVLDVDQEGTYFNYGVGVAGPGTLWVDEPKFEVVGNDVAVTPTFEGEQTIGDWLMTGVGAADFDFRAQGKDVHIERKVSTSQRFVAVVRAVPAKPYLGKTVKASLEVQTGGLDSDGVCILKVQVGKDLMYSGFLKNDKQTVPASTKGFTRCNLSTTIPDDAKWILYGFTYRGAGSASIRGGTLK